MQSDREMVKQILAGNQRTIAKFYRDHKKLLARFIASKIANKKDAEEILQDTFISALDSLPMFQFNASLTGWLKAIAYHEVVDYYRRQKIKSVVFSHFPFLEKIVDRALGPELALQEKEAKIKIWITLKSLNEGYREILRLKYIEGFSYAEIAEDLQLTLKAVESRLSRARLAFQKEFVQNKNLTKKDWQILLATLDQRELSF